MKKINYIRLLIVVTPTFFLVGDVLAQTSSTSLSCPPNHALSIDPPPQLADDPISPESYKPLSAADKLQAEQQAKANELARWHCVPLDFIRNQ